MDDQEISLTDPQRKFLNTFLLQAGAEAIGQRFDLVRHGHRKYIRRGEVEVALNMADKELMGLARAGYLQVSASPAAVILTQKILDALPPQAEMTERKPDVYQTEEAGSPNLRVLQVDIVQVYAWLIVSIIAALFCLFLLWWTVQNALEQNISESVLSGIMTAITGLVSAVFFRNYDKANEHLKYLRSRPGYPTRERDQ